MKKILLLLIIVLAIITIFAYQYYSGVINYVLDSDSTDRIIVNVRQGDTAGDVADQLYEKGLIKSAPVFNFYLDQKDLEAQVKAGRIVVQKNVA